MKNAHRSNSKQNSKRIVGEKDTSCCRVDNLLRGGQRTVAYTKKLTVEDLKRAIRCLDDMGRLMGRDNPIYLAAVEGIMAGAYLDPTDVRNGFESVKLRDIVLSKCAEHGIK